MAQIKLQWTLGRLLMTIREKEIVLCVGLTLEEAEQFSRDLCDILNPDDPQQAQMKNVQSPGKA